MAVAGPVRVAYTLQTGHPGGPVTIQDSDQAGSCGGQQPVADPC